MIDVAYADPSGQSSDVYRMDYQYIDTPRVNDQLVAGGADVIVARVGNSQIVLGSGGYFAPRS